MVEGARLESVYTGNRIEGSNPSPSAKTVRPTILPNRFSETFGSTLALGPLHRMH